LELKEELKKKDKLITDKLKELEFNMEKRLDLEKRVCNIN